MPAYYERLYPVERVPGGVGIGGLTYVANGIGPHASVIRWAYTVPTGKAAMVEGIAGFLVRTLAAGAAAVAQIGIYDSNNAFWLTMQNYSAALGASDMNALGFCGFLKAGEQLFGLTLDASTGGTYNYAVSAHWHEFAV